MTFSAYATPINGGKYCILVVDDSDGNLLLFKRTFSPEYNVLTAQSGAIALRMCDESHPDLILLDVQMPEMDGMEVLATLKSHPRICDIPVIFTTSKASPEMEAAGLAAGAVDFLAKPINVAVAKARVRTHLMLSQSRKEVQILNVTLEQRVEKRTLELQSALSSLTETQQELVKTHARATLTTLVAGVSHELGTPIGNCLMVSDLVRKHSLALKKTLDERKIDDPVLYQISEHLERGSQLLRNNLDRAANLVDKFHHVAKDMSSEHRRRFRLHDVVSETMYSLSPSLRQQPHTVELDIDKDIMMDSLPGPLGQVVINLVNNAYMHAFLPRQTGLVMIHARTTGTDVEIRVTDNGIGIDDAKIASIFDMFYSSKMGKGGTGLGLAIVQTHVCKALRGSITAQSTVGVGSTFVVRLPISLDAKASF